MMNYGYTVYLSPEISEAVFLPDSRCFYGIREYMKIGIPCVIMICLDGWAWHLMSFTSGYIGVYDQAAMIVVMNIVVMIYQMSMGLQQASTTLIGQRIGDGDVENARLYYSSLRKITLILIFFMIIVQFILRDYIVSLFTDVPEVKQKAIEVIWLISFNTFPDLYKGMLKGLIGALGLQHKAVWVNLFC